MCKVCTCKGLLEKYFSDVEKFINFKIAKNKLFPPQGYNLFLSNSNLS